MRTFSVGERVVYPTHGVGIIKNISEVDLTGTPQEYYSINFPSLEMDILVPLQSADMMGLRPLSSAEDTKKALLSLSEKKVQKTSDWKQRQNEQQSLLKTGSIDNIALLVNILYNRQKTRDLPIQERKIFDTALSHLVDESGFVLGLDEDETRRRIFSKLERIK